MKKLSEIEIPDAFKIKDELGPPLGQEKKYRDLKDALKGCIDAMQAWGEEEDGIPGHAWQAFVKASETWRAS